MSKIKSAKYGIYMAVILYYVLRFVYSVPKETITDKAQKFTHTDSQNTFARQ